MIRVRCDACVPVRSPSAMFPPSNISPTFVHNTQSLRCPASSSPRRCSLVPYAGAVSIRFTPASRATANSSDKSRVEGSFGATAYFKPSVRPNATRTETEQRHAYAGFAESTVLHVSDATAVRRPAAQRNRRYAFSEDRWRRKQGQHLVAEIRRERELRRPTDQCVRDGGYDTLRRDGAPRIGAARRDRHATTRTVRPTDRATAGRPRVHPARVAVELIRRALHRHSLVARRGTRGVHRSYRYASSPSGAVRPSQTAARNGRKARADLRGERSPDAMAAAASAAPHHRTG